MPTNKMEAQMDQQQKLELTDSQEKAFAKLKKAFAECQKAGLYVWSDSGRISAVNGRHITCISTLSERGELLDRSNVEHFSSKSWHGENSDDHLYVEP